MVWFGGIEGSIRRAGEDSTVLRVEARARLQGEARFQTSLLLDPRGRPLEITAWKGSVGPLEDPDRTDRRARVDLTSFNEMLVPLEGVQLTAGRLDSLWFDARVSGGRAAGSLTAIYDDLKYRVVSRETGEQGVGSWIKSLFAPSVHSRNPPGKGAALRSGQVEARLEPTRPFFGFLWVSLRSGIGSLIDL